MKGLFFELPIGLHLNGEVHKNVELLKTNGVAEKVLLKKLPEKPFTWQGNVCAITIKSIGDIEIGSETRKKYLEDGSVTLPSAIKSLTLADVNTLIVEIHRRCWVNKIPRQEVICKYCGRRLIADIDLDKIDYFPETKEFMEQLHDYEKITVDLSGGFEPPAIPRVTDKEEFAGITDIVFNRFVFRPPLLSDAIKHEAHFTDGIGFWRRIAMDCLLSIQQVNEDGEVIGELPSELIVYYGLKIFNEYLTGLDLKEVRASLTEYLPTLPFAYYEPCGCDEQREIPMVMDASNFFSE